MPKEIVKIVLTVFCDRKDQGEVVESLNEWFSECEVDLYGAPPLITPPSKEEEAEARSGLDFFSLKQDCGFRGN